MPNFTRDNSKSLFFFKQVVVGMEICCPDPLSKRLAAADLSFLSYGDLPQSRVDPSKMPHNQWLMVAGYNPIGPRQDTADGLLSAQFRHLLSILPLYLLNLNCFYKSTSFTQTEIRLVGKKKMYVNISSLTNAC